MWIRSASHQRHTWEHSLGSLEIADASESNDQDSQVKKEASVPSDIGILKYSIK